MKKSELQQIIREEVSKVLNENKATIPAVLNSLSPQEMKKLRDVSMKVYSKAKQQGFKLYVNLKFGNMIELVVQHFNDSHFGTPEHKFMQSMLPLQTKLGKIRVEVTTGNYDGPWDDETMTIDEFLKLIGK
jgi:hypothetical protein